MEPSNPLRNALVNDSVSNNEPSKLEQYKLYVEMADRISSRRLTANSFFLTINTCIIAFASYLSLSDKKEMAVGQYWIVALAGIVLCYIWYRLIRSYKDLNSAKFSVIHQIEVDLPYKLFDAEWEAVGRGDNPDKYLPFTNIEMAVPWVFLCIHTIVLAKSIPWAKFAVMLCSS